MACKGCKATFVDPGKWGGQKYLRGRCPACGHIHPVSDHPPRSGLQEHCIAMAKERQETCGLATSSSTTSTATA